MKLAVHFLSRLDMARHRAVGRLVAPKMRRESFLRCAFGHRADSVNVTVRGVVVGREESLRYVGWSVVCFTPG